MRRNKRKVPVLSDNEIDMKAEELLKGYTTDFLSEPQMLDVEDFAEFYLDYPIHYTQLSNSGFIWGNMVFQNSYIFKYDAEKNVADKEFVYGNTIVIETRISSKEHALRSTIAHEIGHGIFHKDYFCRNYQPEQLAFSFEESADDAINAKYCATFCSGQNIQGSRNEPRRFITDLDWIEHQAKYFSAALLMPKKVIYMLLDDYKSTRPAYENSGFINNVADIFNVSAESARIRIKSLSNVRTKENSTLPLFAPV